ncbi:DUF5906 domain-containing protein [Thalassotalea fonticola]|uniref:DUF5906 domain-containing protein n=1 Tax=Thalassotalea fonticola TaxID=3065649 RepID=A0ABZ0GUC3_9GAMM|nr:DUF5906 domain-containing protein [Colwelliaceae bacterium S1-1]
MDNFINDEYSPSFEHEAVTPLSETNQSEPLWDNYPLTHQGALMRNTPVTENNQNQSNYNFINDKPLSANDLQRLEALNMEYTHVTVGSKHKIVSKKHCPVDGKSIAFESLLEFKSYFLHEPKVVGFNLGEAWLSWPGKNFKPGGVSFYPNPSKCPDTVFNFFEGFALKPKEGDVKPFITHIKKVICNGDEKASNYVIGFLAHMVQEPDDKPSVAVIMKSVEGTGKGTLFEPIKRILGNLAVQVNGAYQLTGRFNSVSANKLLVFADEVNLTDPRTADKLKGLISEPRLSLERKGLDVIQVPNYCRFFFASNHDNVISAGSRERRYIVLEPSAEYAQNIPYFKKLWQWIDNDGAEYLLHYLMNYDISDFNPRKAPMTQALLDEKLASLSPYQEFLINELLSDKPFDGQRRISTQDMIRNCRHWLDSNHHQLSEPRVRSGLGKLLSRLGIKPIGKSGRNAYYELPEKIDFQRKFANALGHKLEEIFD